MIQFLFSFADWGFLALRLVLGSVLIAHGLPKLKNLKGTSESFAGMGYKPGVLWGTLVPLLEVFGGLALVLGLFTQVIAALVAGQFVVILLTIKRSASFGDKEVDILILAAALSLLATGGGEYSLDEYFGLILY